MNSPTHYVEEQESRKRSRADTGELQHQLVKVKRFDENESRFILNFNPIYNNFKCFFLKRKFYVEFKIYSSAACLTKLNSLAVFSFVEKQRQQLYSSVNEMLSTLAMPSTTATHNPFENVPGGGPVFIRLAANCQWFRATEDGTPIRIRATDVENNRCFRMRLALTLKGAKMMQSTLVVSPMLVATQVLILHRHAAADAVNDNDRCCILNSSLSEEEEGSTVIV
jgi:hypothetical protein